MTTNTAADDRSRGDRTAARLEAIAVELVLEHGLQNVTVDDICERAEISQRTFFNHFRTKEEAVFGRDIEGIDEAAAREFLAAGTDDVLADTMRLMIATQARHGDISLLLKRKQLIHADPVLINKHMARMRSVREELRELIALRLKKDAPAGEGEDERRQVAVFITELSGVLLRLGMEQTPEASTIAEPEGSAARVQALLQRALL